MRILDRYVLTSFLMPFLYCFAGLVGVWLLIDLSDNFGDFIEGQVPLPQVIGFYISQLPDTTLTVLPPAMLLGLLYSMGRMSRSNEIISILTAGVSLSRFALPLFVVGLLASLGSTYLNYYLAPKAQADRERLLRQLTGNRQEEQLAAHLFRNRRERRTWYVQKVQVDQGLCQGTQIIQQDEEGNTVFTYYVRRAFFRPQDKTWYFDKGIIARFDKAGNVTSKEFLTGETIISGWDETPWRIASSNLRATHMTVPELRDYLKYNADFTPAQLAPFKTHLFSRWTLPWECFIMVLVATPLGIVYSRRGILAGVAYSIFIFSVLLFMKGLFMSLGEGARIAPIWATITPNLMFLAAGLGLFWMRATNRDPASLNPIRRLRERRVVLSSPQDKKLTRPEGASA